MFSATVSAPTTASPAPHRLAGIGWMVAAQACFAGMNVCTRLGARALPWSEVASARFLVGALLAWALARARGSSLRITDWPNSWRRTIFGTLSAAGTFYALASHRIPLGDAATLSATAPVLVALLSARLLGERVGRGLSIAVFLAFLGVTAVVRPSFEAAADVALIASAAAFFYALAMIWLRKIGPGESSEAVVFHFSAFALVVFLLWSLPVWVTPDLPGLAFILATGVFGGAAQLAMTRAYAHDHAARITAFAYLGIVFTHALAAIIFDERPTLWQVGGSLLVITAGVALTLGARRPETTSIEESGILRRTGEFATPSTPSTEGERRA